MSKFWKAYASISDNLRHHLVERAWFGRETTGNIDQNDMPALAPSPDPKSNTANHFYGDTQTSNTINAFYGNGPAQSDPDNFYGTASNGAAIEAPTIQPMADNSPDLGY